jgi:hypothetical protein
MEFTNRKKVIVACAAVLLTLATALGWYLHVAHLQRVQGVWEGTLRFHVGQVMRKQRIVLRILRENGACRAVLDQVDLGRKDIPTTALSAGWSSVTFESQSNFVFRGRLNSEGTEITGRWNWVGGRRSQPLTFTRTTAPDVIPEPLAPADYAQRPGSDLQGLWGGTLMIGTNSLRLRFKVAESAAGRFRCELNSVDQPPVLPIPATSVDYHRPGVTLAFPGIGAIFDGSFDENMTTISGKWTQVFTSPLTLTRINPKTE